MKTKDILDNKKSFIGPTFSLKNRFMRFLWNFVWILLARWTPPPFHKWRIFLINIFGGNISGEAYIYADVKVWAPWNLSIKRHGTLGRGVVCYNIAPVSIGEKAVISQGANLCTGTHDYRKQAFPLTSRPIAIGDHAWICANSFVGPGVTVHDGAILAATGTTFKDLDAWTIYSGNPAQVVKGREKPI